MTQSTRLDLPLLLPEVKDVQDACVVRLTRLLERQPGVTRVHVARAGEVDSEASLSGAATRSTVHEMSADADTAQLCLHYDPEQLSLAEVARLAHAAGVEVSQRFAHVVIPIRAVTTEDDGPRIEAELKRMPGVTACTVSLAGQVVRIEYDRRRTTPDTLSATLESLGAHPYPDTVDDDAVLSPPPTVSIDREGKEPAERDPVEVRSPDAAGDAPHPSWYRRNRELVWSITAGVLMALGWLAEQRYGGGTALPISIFVAAFIFGGRDNVGHFLNDLRRGHFRFNIDLLMVVAAVGAAVLGEWFEGALLLFLFSLGHALEHYALGRARNAIKALADLAPPRALVIREVKGARTEVDIPIAEVRQGDRVLVKPAERFPVDGTLVEGRSAVNQAPITGESVPVDKAPGDKVFAGTVNGEGAVVVEVSGAVGDRTLDRIVKLVAEAQTQKAPTQQFTEPFERIFVPVVLIADVLLIVVPPLLGFLTWSESFYRAMALLVAASPCALALGTPATVLAGIAQAARNGVLIKGGAHLEMLGQIRVLALDKTGTITRGEPVVTDVIPLKGVTEDTLVATAAAVERRSQHPLARAVMGAAKARGVTVENTGDVQAVTARGVRAPVGGDIVEVGRLLMFEEGGSAVPRVVRDTVERLEREGRSTMVVRRRSTGSADSGGWLGVLGIADEPRPNARETLERLRAVGIERIVMLTGDNEGVGNAIGRVVGVDEVRAGLLPEQKVDAIRELAATGLVAMVGDGVNDAPALANATVGIAMGGAGTAAALETADVALMADDLSRLPFAIGLSRQARRIIKQNIYISLGVIGALAIATVTGSAGIGVAVIAHEGSTLLVIANGLRLLAYKRNG